MHWREVTVEPYRDARLRAMVDFDKVLAVEKRAKGGCVLIYPGDQQLIILDAFDDLVKYCHYLND